MKKEKTVEELAGQNTRSKGALQGDASELDHERRAEVATDANKEAHSVPKEESDHEHTTQSRESVTARDANGQAPKPQMDEELHPDMKSKFGTNFVDTKSVRF